MVEAKGRSMLLLLQMMMIVRMTTRITMMMMMVMARMMIVRMRMRITMMMMMRMRMTIWLLLLMMMIIMMRMAIWMMMVMMMVGEVVAVKPSARGWMLTTMAMLCRCRCRLQIVAKEGVRSLYSGVGPSIAAIIPEAAITYGMFDVLKRSYSQMRGIQEPSVVESLAFGVSSAFMGQLVAYPLETVSRRMQVSTAPKQTVFEVMQGIMRKEGISGFYGGVRASMLKVLPMAVFSFGTYEIVRMQLTQFQDQAEAAQVKKECREIHTPGGTCEKSVPTNCDDHDSSRPR